MAEPRFLILIKHSLPEIVQEHPARQWQLNDEGRRRAALLSERLKAFAPMAMLCSDEPKALETAQIAARPLGLEPRVLDGIYEHERRRVGFLATARFVDGVRDLFRFPDKHVFGDETADESYRRFADAIDTTLAAIPTGNIAVVTHGTVLSLFASRRAAIDGFALWQSLDLPAFIVLALPGFRLTTTVRSVLG
jgi:broad specificity phosphatase PhoE